MAVNAGGNWRSSSLVRAGSAQVPGQEGEESPGEAEEPAVSGASCPALLCGSWWSPFSSGS